MAFYQIAKFDRGSIGGKISLLYQISLAHHLHLNCNNVFHILVALGVYIDEFGKVPEAISTKT